MTISSFKQAHLCGWLLAHFAPRNVLDDVTFPVIQGCW